jgi:hypothetical protein
MSNGSRRRRDGDGRVHLGKIDFERGSRTSDAQGRIVIRLRGCGPYTRTADHYAAMRAVHQRVTRVATSRLNT